MKYLAPLSCPGHYAVPLSNKYYVIFAYRILCWICQYKFFDMCRYSLFLFFLFLSLSFISDILIPNPISHHSNYPFIFQYLLSFMILHIIFYQQCPPYQPITLLYSGFWCYDHILKMPSSCPWSCRHQCCLSCPRLHPKKVRRRVERTCSPDFSYG